MVYILPIGWLCATYHLFGGTRNNHWQKLGSLFWNKDRVEKSSLGGVEKKRWIPFFLPSLIFIFFRDTWWCKIIGAFFFQKTYMNDTVFAQHLFVPKTHIFTQATRVAVSDQKWMLQLQECVIPKWWPGSISIDPIGLDVANSNISTKLDFPEVRGSLLLNHHVGWGRVRSL